MAFESGVGAEEEVVFHAVLGRLAGHLEDRAIDVELPGVIATTDPLWLDDAVFE